MPVVLRQIRVLVLWSLGVTCISVLGACSSSRSSSGAATTGPTLQLAPIQSGPVAAQYQKAYQEVASEVAAFSNQVGAAPSRPANTTVGTELLAANGNIGPALLVPAALAGVSQELDAFEALGVKGVTVDVSFPLLLPDTPDSAGYLHFYTEVGQQVRARGMVLSVEENPVFAGTRLTPLTITYRGLTLDSYANDQRLQAQIIIDNLHPDYLTVLDEPDTFSATLGVIGFDSPGAAVQVVGQELAGLRRGTTKVGAGTGSWEGIAIDQALLSGTSIDYLDTHVYPLGPGPLQNLTAEIAAAASAHKALVMDETWLYKPNLSGTTGVAGAPEMLKVDSFSFWAPLDARFVAAMVDYSRNHAFAYASFFDGARCFFGYLPWTPMLQAAGYQSFSVQFNQLVATNMAARLVSSSGQALQRALSTRS